MLSDTALRCVNPKATHVHGGGAGRYVCHRLRQYPFRLNPPTLSRGLFPGTRRWRSIRWQSVPLGKPSPIA
jgi:hypothetical protein